MASKEYQVLADKRIWQVLSVAAFLIFVGLTCALLFMEPTLLAGTLVPIMALIAGLVLLNVEGFGKTLAAMFLYWLAFLFILKFGFPPRIVEYRTVNALVSLVVIVLACRFIEPKFAVQFGIALFLGLLVAGFSGSAGGGDPMVEAIMRWFGWSQEYAETFIHFTRKTLHFVFYGLMALFLCLAAARVGYKHTAAAMLGIGWALAHSIFDEARQLTSPGRSGSIWDVLLDLAGAFAFAGIWAWTHRSRKLRV